MIIVKIFRSSSGNILGYDVSGHSGAAAEGEDIICAGVSALTQTTCLGLSMYVSENVCINQKKNKKSSILSCTLPDGLSSDLNEKADLLVATMLLGLQEIAGIYPDNLRIID